MLLKLGVRLKTKKNTLRSCKVEADRKRGGVTPGQRRRRCLCLDLCAEMAIGAIPRKKISMQYLLKE